MSRRFRFFRKPPLIPAPEEIRGGAIYSRFGAYNSADKTMLLGELYDMVCDGGYSFVKAAAQDAATKLLGTGELLSIYLPASLLSFLFPKILGSSDGVQIAELFRNNAMSADMREKAWERLLQIDKTGAGLAEAFIAHPKISRASWNRGWGRLLELDADGSLFLKVLRGGVLSEKRKSEAIPEIFARDRRGIHTTHLLLFTKMSDELREAGFASLLACAELPLSTPWVFLKNRSAQMTDSSFSGLLDRFLRDYHNAPEETRKELFRLTPPAKTLDRIAACLLLFLDVSPDREEELSRQVFFFKRGELGDRLAKRSGKHESEALRQLQGEVFLRAGRGEPGDGRYEIAF